LQNCKFIAGKAYDQVCAPDYGGKPPRSSAQQFFLRGMAKIGGGVAHPVKIEHIHYDTRWAAPRPDQSGGDAGREHGEIGKARDRI